MQRRSVKLIEAKLLPAIEDESLGGVLTEWNKTLEGPIAASSLELRVAEQRLLHSLAR